MMMIVLKEGWEAKRINDRYLQPTIKNANRKNAKIQRFI